MAPPNHSSGSRTAHTAPAVVGWLLPIGFLALAALLLARSRPPEIPIAPPAQVDRAQLVVGPRRATMPDPPHLTVEGQPQSCNGCHQIFRSNSPARATLAYHNDIRLRHGLNDRCVNCHDVADRQRLTLRDGATVPFQQTPALCSQCHGTVFRDWQNGTHGKTLGSWVTGSAAQQRLDCNQCHDPHEPRYPRYAPLPGPNTLRMGDQHHAYQPDQPPRSSPLLRRPPAPEPPAAPSPGNGAHQ